MAGEIFGSKDEFKLRPIEISNNTKRFRNLKEKLSAWSRRFLLVFVLFLAWEILPSTGLVSPIFFPKFSVTVLALMNLISSGELLIHIEASLQRSIIGYGLAMIVAIPLGLIMGWYSSIEKYTDLLIQTLRNTSLFALLPLFIMLFGIGETSKIIIVFYAALWYMLINTISGVKSVDPLYIKAAKSFGISDIDLFKKIILPASIPSIISGARLSAKTAVMVVIAAEMLAAKSGLGYFVQNSQLMYRIPEMYAGILTLAIIGLSLNYLLVWLEKKATYWKGDIDTAMLVN
ncbi:MAG: ABC transporter permease [Candidatus Methanoperedens sp.]